MSTKIHHGYWIETVPLLEMRERFASLSKRVTAITKKSVDRLVGKLAVEAVDCAVVGQSSELHDAARKAKRDHVDPLADAYLMVADRNREIQRTMRRDPLFDFSFSVCVVPTKGPRTLALLYTDREEYQKAWAACRWVHSYPYYDNTDQPKGITRREWNARGREWDRALRHGGGIPARNGFTFDVTGDYIDYPRWQDVVDAAVAAFPKRVRAQALAENKLIGEHMKEAGERRKRENAEAEDRASDWMHDFYVGRRFLRDEPEGQAKLEAETVAIEALLPDITLDLLKAKTPVTELPVATPTELPHVER